MSKGEAPLRQVEIPHLKSELSQQVSHVVGTELKPAQTKGHDDHDGGKGEKNLITTILS